MKRDPARFTDKQYDLLVVGGGIHGACIAWDAASRGLAVALIDKGDFGHATSANSLKTVHGGLRYLQDGNLKLVRTMIQERKALLHIAPHLVHPLTCVMPTYKQLMRSKAIMGIALTLNDLLGFDRNRLADPQKHLPRGRLLSKDECLEIMPGIADKSLTGGAVWHDAQMYNTERMTLSFILSAIGAGAEAANYVEAVEFLREGDTVTGVKAKDVLTDGLLEIQARVVANTAGPWAEQLLKLADGPADERCFQPSVAINLVTRQIVPDYAIGIPSRYEFKDGKAIPLKKSRMLFISPWRNRSIVGTVHLPYEGEIDKYRVPEEKVRNFLDEINAAYPEAALKPEDVHLIHQGFLPADPAPSASGVKLIRQGQVIENSLDGIITVVGVKYTTARKVAEQAVDLVFKKLDKAPPLCSTDVTPIYGGQIERFENFVAQELAKYSNKLRPEVLKHLIYNYGSAYTNIANLVAEEPDRGETLTPETMVTKAEVLHGIREEMAQRLTDVILRRTELGSAGWPGETCLRTCADIMATHLDWDQVKTNQEIDEVRAFYAATLQPELAQTEQLHP